MKKTIKIDLPRVDEFVGFISVDPTSANYFLNIMEGEKVTETFLLYTCEWVELEKKYRERNEHYRKMFETIEKNDK